MIAIAASFAFMFPVATPPNAIVYQTGRIRMLDMVLAGFVTNLMGIGLSMLAVVTYGDSFFNLTGKNWMENYISTNSTYEPLSY